MFFKGKVLIFFCVLLIGSVVVSLSWGFSRQPPVPVIVPGKVIVKFHDDVSPDRITSIVEQEGGQVKTVLASTGIHIILLTEGVDVADAVIRFSSYKEVQYAEPVQKASSLEEK